jgi:hypothetical protein
MKPLKFGNVLVCEFATNGENNKHTLVNIFHGDIILAEIPTILSLAFYFEVIPGKAGEHAISFDFMVDDRKLATLQAFFSSTNPEEPAPLIIQRFEFPVEKDCTLSVLASASEIHAQRIILRKIYKNKNLTS